MPTVRVRALERPWEVVLAGALAVFVAQGTGRFVLTPLLPSMQAELGLDDVAAGLLGSINFAGYLLGAVAVSFVAGLPPGPLVRWGLLLVTGSAVATAAVANWPVWLAARLLAGVGGAFLFLGAVAAAANRLFALGRPVAMGGVLAGVGVGIASGGAVALVTRPDWRVAWLAMAAIGVLGWPLLARLAGPAPSGARPQARLVRSPALVRLACAYGFSGLAFGAGATFFVRVFAGRDPELATLAWIGAGLVAGPSAPLWAALGRRIGGPSALALAILVLAAGTAFAGIPAAASAIVVSGLLIGATFMGITTLALDQARTASIEAPAAAVAFVTVSFGTGQVLGPLLAGLLLERFGPLEAMLVPAVLALLGASVLLADMRLRP
ncbi:MAG: YbfB/YjiJ family MFS transporter [Geminicoccaceae bacterium]|nr:YbfB/YjiJ family MFS transporter [Geminicoccaceae bacterium]MDW8369010.1 YbfB/YjiJ family MFS transporter [Geminicoccaceae bacterium]